MKNTYAAGGPRDKKIDSHLDNDNDADNQDLRLLFDERAENDDPLKASQATGERKFSVINFLRSKLDKISNWFQSAGNYVRNLFVGLPNTNALINIRSNPGVVLENKNSQSSIYVKNSADVLESYPENNNSHAEYESGFSSENSSKKEESLKDFNQFKLMFQKRKNHEITSIYNFITEKAKSYAAILIADADEKVKNDPNHFFKNISEYKDIEVAFFLLGKSNKFELSSPTKDQEKNFKLWVHSKKAEGASELARSGLSVDLEKAKVYANWICFKNAIGDLPNSVDESDIPHAIELKGMMDKVEADAKIKLLNQSIDKIDADMLYFFTETKEEKDKSSSVVSDKFKSDDNFSGFPKLNKDNINLIWKTIFSDMNSKEFNKLLINSASFFDGLNNPKCEVDFLLDKGLYALTFSNLWSKALNDPKKLEIIQSQAFFSDLKILLDSEKIESHLAQLTHGGSRFSFYEPLAVVESKDLYDSFQNAEILSSPPPPPSPRLKAAGDAAAVPNATVLVDVAQSAPPPAPSPRVRKNSEEIQQKPSGAVIASQPLAKPEMEPNNLTLSSCIDVFKNLERGEQNNLGKILAPEMTSADFRSLFNQSSLFFTDLVNGRPINSSRQDEVSKLSKFWDSAKTQLPEKDGLRQLKFYLELDYLLTMFKR